MSRKDIPDGYAVVQLDDGRWYPLDVVWSYSARHPEGEASVCSFLDHERNVHYATRKQAVDYCKVQAQEDEKRDQWRWARLEQRHECYPERCVHYRDLIEEMTGERPIELPMMGSHASVIVYLPTCWNCGGWHLGQLFDRETLDEALHAAAEWTYEQMMNPCACMKTEARIAS